MSLNNPALCALLATMLILSLAGQAPAGDSPQPAAPQDASKDPASKDPAPKDAAAKDPAAKETPNGGLVDTVKDAVKDTVKGVMDGTLKEKVSDTLKGAMTVSADDGSSETKIVLRVSKEFVRKHAPPPVEHVAPVNKCLFGSRVTGTAVTRGRPSLTMGTDHSKPVFTLHFKGTTTTHTVAVKHPVKAYNTGVAVFDVHRPIHFDGTQFTDGPESIEATYSSKLDGLSTPPGLRGCIVRRFATPQIEAMKPKADAIALADTKATVLAEFGKHSDELVSDLNARLPWKQTMTLLLPQQTKWEGHFASTKDWILASPGPHEATMPDLPEEGAKAQAPIELWVHGKPGDGTAAKVVAIWSAVHFGLDPFRGPAGQAVKKLKDVEPAIVGDWWVIRVGADLAESMIGQLEKDEEAE